MVSFYPRLSGGLSSRNADPVADGLSVRGSVKARRALVNAPKKKLEAVNELPSVRVRLFSVTDQVTGEVDVISPGHQLVVYGDNIPIDTDKPDEGIWLEKRRKGKVATATVRKSAGTQAEFFFRDSVPDGKYFVVVGSRCGQGNEYRVVRARHEVKVVSSR